MELDLKVSGMVFKARLEKELAPRSCAIFEAMLPFRAELIQARWSGEAAWIPLGDRFNDLPVENPTSAPKPGQLLLHPGGQSESEILFPYGLSTFASKDGLLIGNHFLTVASSDRGLAELGRRVLWEGAQEILFERS